METCNVVTAREFAVRHRDPEVPWSAAARMRDRLVHHYFDINLDVLWSTVTEDLPRLLAVLPDHLVELGSESAVRGGPHEGER